MVADILVLAKAYVLQDVHRLGPLVTLWSICWRREGAQRRVAAPSDSLVAMAAVGSSPLAAPLTAVRELTLEGEEEESMQSRRSRVRAGVA